MTGRRGFGAAVLAIGVMASIASMVARLPRAFHPPQALRWSKLAAERLETATRNNDTRMYFSALGAADHALRIDPTLPDALFLRAMTLECLGLFDHAAIAYANYVKLDHRSPLADLALLRMRRTRALAPNVPYAGWGTAMKELRATALAGQSSAVAEIVRRFPTESASIAFNSLGRWAEAILRRPDDAMKNLMITREIGRALVSVSGDRLIADVVAVIDAALKRSDAKRIELLVRGHRLYAAGAPSPWYSLIAQARVEEAAVAFQQANSPMKWAAEYERVSRRAFIFPSEEICNAIPHLLHRTPKGYRSLRGLMYQYRSRCLAISGEYTQALESGRHAIALFAALNDYDSANTVRLELIEMLERVDDRDAVWRLRGEALHSPVSNSEWGSNWMLLEIARDAIAENAWDMARSAATLVIESRAPNNTLRVDGRIVRAVAAWNQREIASAKYDLNQARLATTSTNAGTQKVAHRQIDEAELELIRQSTPSRSTELLEKILANALVSWNMAEICERLLQDARSYRELNKHREAAAVLTRILNLLAESPTALASRKFSTDLHTELIGLLDTRDEAADAFAVSETGRSRLLLDRFGYKRPPLTVEGVRRMLAPRTLIVSFVTLRDRILIFSIDQRSSHVTRVRISRTEVKKRIGALRSAFEHGADWRPAAALLHETLFGSLRLPVHQYDTVVIVPDALLEEIPFATLMEPATKRLLIERSAVVIAPSASVYVTYSAMKEAPREHTLIIGDPAFSATQFPRLQRLPAAGAEANAIASSYGSSALIGDAARPAAILARLRTADVIHIGAHTVIDVEAPMASQIVMTDGGLRARDILWQRVRPGSIAVLAGCRTATRAGKFHINSLALAFLAAGSRSSIASLWDVDDAPTRQFSISLHRLLRDGVSAAEAVRRVQLEMMRSPDPQVSDVRAWAAFQVYGGG